MKSHRNTTQEYNNVIAFHQQLLQNAGYSEVILGSGFILSSIMVRFASSLKWACWKSRSTQCGVDFFTYGFGSYCGSSLNCYFNYQVMDAGQSVNLQTVELTYGQETMKVAVSQNCLPALQDCLTFFKYNRETSSRRDLHFNSNLVYGKGTSSGSI